MSTATPTPYAQPPQAVDKSVLAGRIQGFGNVNPPPLEDETASTVAKRAVNTIGNKLGEEVMLTVEDFKEKGAVGAVKDAVADAGDILIDGVSAVVGWLRGDPPPEEEDASAEDATKALSNGPSGAAYGVSQASPTGGINAVWVMPDEADPATLAQLIAEQGGPSAAKQLDPRVPKNIQPYEPPASAKGAPPAPANMMTGPVTLPGGPLIAPYQPAPGGGPVIAPYQPATSGGGPFVPQGRWGPAGYSTSSTSGPSPPASTAGPASGAKSLVERIAKGEVYYGPDVAKRLVGQCNAASVTAKQLSEMVCERARRLYLGLDGGDPSDADAGLANLLGLLDALAGLQVPLASQTIKETTSAISEELLSLRSSSKYKATAEPMLAKLGLISRTEAAADSDLLGGDAPATAAPASAAPAAAAQAPEADLLGGTAAPSASSAVGSSAVVLDPLVGPEVVSGGDAGALSGLSLDMAPPSLPAAPAMPIGGGAAGFVAAPAAPPPKPAAAGVDELTALALEGKKKKEGQDAFSFVGDELSKAGTKP